MGCAGTGFLPKETAEHHRKHVVELVRQAIKEAGIDPSELDCVCYTKGPGMGGPLRVCAVVARMLSQVSADRCRDTGKASCGKRRK